MKLSQGDKVIYTNSEKRYNFSGIVKAVRHVENKVASHDRAEVIINPNPFHLQSVECNQEFLAKVS